jgi:hypothetical protein
VAAPVPSSISCANDEWSTPRCEALRLIQGYNDALNQG